MGDRTVEIKCLGDPRRIPDLSAHYVLLMPPACVSHGILSPLAAIYFPSALLCRARSNDRAAMGDIIFLLLGLGFFAAFGFYAIFCDRQ